MSTTARRGWFGSRSEIEVLGIRQPRWARYRRRTAVALIDNFFVWLAALSRYQPYASARRHGVELLRDIPYLNSGRREHTLDVYRPTARPGPWPVVLYVHGGGFRILSKDTHWLLALLFARRGFLTFNINYRLAPEHKYPAAIEDVAAAFRWVARNAAAFGGDGRIVLAGESAGANLVTALSVATSFLRPEPWARRVFDTGVQPLAVLPFCGILQVSEIGRLKHEGRFAPVVLDYLQVVAEAYLPAEPGGLDLDFADPLVVFERDLASDRPLPSYFLIVGGRDPLLDDTRRLETALRRRGADVEARYYDGEPHAFHAYVWRRAARQSWRDTFDFLAKRLAPPPPVATPT